MILLRHLCLFVLLASSVAFENAKARKRRQAMHEAVGLLKTGGQFSTVEAKSCAACEAVARNLETKMARGHHLTGEVERLAVLYEACDGDERNVPQPIKPGGDGGEEILHYFQVSDELASQIKGSTDQFGLGEFCTVLLEEFEDELTAAVAAAKPVSSAVSAKMGGLAAGEHRNLMYEMKQAVCVQATSSCSDDTLNRISNGRIMQAIHQAKTDPVQAKRLESMFAAIGSGASGDGEEQKATAPSQKRDAANDDSDGDEGKTSPQTAAKSTAPPKAKSSRKKVKSSKDFANTPFSATLMGSALASPYAMVIGAAVTLPSIYVGGLVARLW